MLRFSAPSTGIAEIATVSAMSCCHDTQRCWWDLNPVCLTVLAATCKVNELQHGTTISYSSLLREASLYKQGKRNLFDEVWNQRQHHIEVAITILVA